MPRTCPFLTDPDQVRTALHRAPVPHVPPVRDPLGLAWLRAHVPRFCDGPDHTRRRALVLAELDRLSPADLRARARTAAHLPLAHVQVLIDELGLPGASADAVKTIAAHYQPHEPDSAAADAAVVELVAACGGVADEATAARICVLVQACAATDALLANVRALDAAGTPEERIARTMRENPPLRATRRVMDGELVELDMRHPGLGFGVGPHACPGREHAIALAAGILEGAQQ
ncbi:hypothetical protein [Nocardia crassostreae]|uniref:hypothetical protein n=1 Tax=Nocardia crassostreae TaxID=53428 RepID=UPI00082F8062|nr:hypothetical protein [Nocardia crassostreae]